MSHLYFITVLDKDGRNFVQEVKIELFQWLIGLPKINSKDNEPNLLQLERYPKEGLFQCNQDTQTYYAGIVKMPDDSLVQQYHYFTTLVRTKLKPNKRRPFLIEDFAVVKLQLKKQLNTGK